MSFVQKVLTMIKGGDQGKVERFYKRLKTGLSDQIEARRREKGDLWEKVEDLNETFDVDLYTIDLAKLKDTESIKKAAADHVEKLLKNKREVRQTQEQMDKIGEEIEHLQSIISTMDGSEKKKE